ncbi:MAG: hypothetical protein IT308_12075 [Anaerolineaceae bacterium]|nr:hypothetical protein [Anaerolineaceae bacterium]
MSRDIDLFSQHPSFLFWHENVSSDPAQNYRLLDAPLTRYLIGIGRRIAGGQLPTPEDWDWSKTWDENREAEALPNNLLLLTARASTAFLFPITCLIIYAIGALIESRKTAWLSFLLFAGNALILLHTRRAMAESALVFAVALTIWVVLKFPDNPWLLALASALAFNAKQSAIALSLWTVLALIFLGNQSTPWRKRFFKLLAYTVLFVGITFLLNPFLWNSPFKAAPAAWHARSILLEKQVVSFGDAAPGQILFTPGRRLTALAANLYILPPQVAEAGNYLAETQTTTQDYFSNPFHNLLRGLAGGAFFLTLTIFGVVMLLRQTCRGAGIKRQHALLLSIGGFLQLIGLLAAVPLPFQRYVVPLIPFTCLYIAYGLVQLTKVKKRRDHSA